MIVWQSRFNHLYELQAYHQVSEGGRAGWRYDPVLLDPFVRAQLIERLKSLLIMLEGQVPEGVRIPLGWAGSRLPVSPGLTMPTQSSISFELGGD